MFICFQTKAGLVDLIDSTFAKEKEETKVWEQKLNKEGILVHIKKGGSAFDKSCPFVRSEMAFNQYYQMQKVIEAVTFVKLTMLDIQHESQAEMGQRRAQV